MRSLDLFRRESNMPIWMIGGCPGGLSCSYNPVSGLQRFLCHAIMSIAMAQKSLKPNGCGRSTLVKNRHKKRHTFLLIAGTRYEISLASWPSAVALIYSVAMCIEMLDSSCFLRG